MSKKAVYSITEKIKFSGLVFLSWMIFGFVLAIILEILFGIISGFWMLILDIFWILPILFCVLGLVGLGTDILQGKTSEYNLGYWFFLPFLTLARMTGLNEKFYISKQLRRVVCSPYLPIPPSQRKALYVGGNSENYDCYFTEIVE
ncbi:hypothetical protein PN466_21825 [Roseofilum reptotaenium CS-1145]|uniref:Uncharacterized protein n=1 Tax=Roseofilum reptotaenium AO1-A TaxID=1925591 RepID=A0A1L9QSI2_9CYAN|nr:hypothetical protein [Roseofilum reptotaenium]MDB9519587.1 hypothetical protein [Roseofilum reptotaenium CS-1145]OJJ25623.1 hypothetical protein BI308_10780 [Roseofilum reptotaenium AO1-A]